MKAISLWQPWASLWLSPHKIDETRHWYTACRGEILVHAAKQFEKDHPPELAEILRQEFGTQWFKALPIGALIGRVNIVSCMHAELIAAKPETVADRNNLICGNFGHGRWAWRRAAEFEVFKTPIPYVGRQGFFNVPDDIVPRIAA